MFPIIYGILFGGLVAGVYLFISIFGHAGGLSLFAASSIAIFLGHLAIWPKKTSAGILNPKMLIRGILFGLTQILVVKAQSLHHTSTAFVAATMGSVFGVVFGRVVLKENVRRFGLLGIITCCAAGFTNPSMLFSSYWGILAGFIQGASVILARSLILDQKSSTQAIPVGFLLGGLLTIAFLGSEGSLRAGMRQLSPQDFAIAVLFALATQYAFFFLYKILDSQRASALLLTRIPWSMALEFLFFSTFPHSRQLVAATLIATGSLCLLFDSRRRASSPVNM